MHSYSRSNVIACIALCAALWSPQAICAEEPAKPKSASPPKKDSSLADAEKELELKKIELKKARLEASHQKKLREIQRQIAGADVAVLLDGKTGWQSQQRIKVDEGDEITFRIINTSRECYTFNFVEVETTAKPQGAAGELDHSDIVEFSTIHVETTGAYEITASLLSGKTAEQCPYAKSWRVGVTPTGWELGFAGSYIVDRLTSPAYALRAGTGVNAGTNEIVIEDKEDKWNRGAAAMIHLYNSGSFDLGRSVSWAPVAFGIGLQTDDATYYFGTGFKFGRQAFLTAGVAIGPRDELGPGLQVGDFISEPNLALQSRTDAAFYAGISFSFLNANISQKFQEPFNIAEPKPKDAPETKPDEEAPTADAPLTEASATPEKLSSFLLAADKPYVIKSITGRDPEDGDSVTEWDVVYSRSDKPATEQDDKALKEFLEAQFPGSKFNLTRTTADEDEDPQ